MIDFKVTREELDIINDALEHHCSELDKAANEVDREQINAILEDAVAKKENIMGRIDRLIKKLEKK